uniref:glutaminase n=1 Tax=Ditylenchus dipsaci TaxID=166011 RepID=A0A915EJB7_9BILA
MYSCGMYDYSGQFAFHVGLPAKSGVSGAMIVVVPNLMGICLWSPPLDKMGNSTRGVLFCQKLIDTFNFHNYDSLLHADSKKIDPRRRLGNKETDLIVSLLFACKNGDLETVRRLFLQGVNLNVADYDGRTALHLAACEGHTIICKFLLNIAKVDYTMQDRWGRTALDDARLFHQTSCVAVLVKAASKKSRMGDDRRLASIGERDFCNNGHNGDVAPDEEGLDVGPSIPTSEEDEQQSCGIMMMGHSIEVENDEGKHLSMSLDRLSLCNGHSDELVLSEPDSEQNGVGISQII